ncbi:MAG TPA: glycoside hydrolase family 99-like domain-containing protein [Bacteroidales bacterium]|nr:glycoside hydrolase family 99-like domain-containing protein [Bacteroidales bacterium]
MKNNMKNATVTMNNRSNQSILVYLLFLISGVLFAYNGAFAQKRSSNNYDIAAFVWPSYHPDDRAKIFWPDGIGEWQTVKDNKPKYEGHEQARQPLWGYINEADPYVAEMEIEAATDHGVNVFIFDWYWYDGLPFLEGHLNDGFLKAKNNEKMRFYIMWANHDAVMTWDKRNAGKVDESVKIWRGGVDRREFEIIVHRMIDKYFHLPNYYKVDGKPSFMIYDLSEFINGLGGEKEAKDALDWFRKEVMKAGYKGLDLQLTLRSIGYKITGIAGEIIGTQEKMVKNLGFNGITHYQYVHFTDVDRDYNAINADVYREWERIENAFEVPYYPHVSIGWDNNPRFEMFRAGVVKNNTPVNFEKALIMAKEYVDKHPYQALLITINSWNEWTETSYLQPCTLYGYGYLNAVKNVFKPVK